jgi:hypothetical protein
MGRRWRDAQKPTRHVMKNRFTRGMNTPRWYREATHE